MFSGVIGGGGNFLLCVGPMGDGRIPVIMQERLLQIGEWLKINGDAVYGTTASPFWPRQFDWGTISTKPGKLYLHIQNPELNMIEINGIEAQVSKANLFHKDGKIPVSFTNNGTGIILEWAAHLNDEAVTIIELDVIDDYKVDKTSTQFTNGNIEFNCWAMEVHGDKAYPHYDGYQNRLRMLNWTDPKEFLTAEIIIHQTGEFELSMLYGATKGDKGNEFLAAVPGTVGAKYEVSIGENTFQAKIVDTGNSNIPKQVKAGTIKIDQPGKYTFSLKPVDDGKWTEFRFQGVELKMIK
jgi:alpha-L-fucosidase